MLLAAGGGFAFHEHRSAVKEANALGGIASQLSGRTVHVHCQSLAAAALDVAAEDGSVTLRRAGQSRPTPRT